MNFWKSTPREPETKKFLFSSFLFLFFSSSLFLQLTKQATENKTSSRVYEPIDQIRLLVEQTNGQSMIQKHIRLVTIKHRLFGPPSLNVSSSWSDKEVKSSSLLFWYINIIIIDNTKTQTHTKYICRDIQRERKPESWGKSGKVGKNPDMFVIRSSLRLNKCYKIFFWSWPPPKQNLWLSP